MNLEEGLGELGLDAEDRAAFLRGVDEMRAGRYFEAHETLEEVWMGLRGRRRNLVQGLIQVAVGLHHWIHANPKGAASVLGRALKRWEGLPPALGGLELDAARAEVGAWLAAIAAGETAPPEVRPRFLG